MQLPPLPPPAATTPLMKSIDHLSHLQAVPVASKGTPGDAKSVTEIPGDKNKEVKGETKFTF